MWRRCLDAAICLALAVAVILVYVQVRDFGFVNFDDDRYVTANPHVQFGLSASTVRWAFSLRPFEFDGLYIPLTWLSLMLDAGMHGLDAGGFHLTNMWLHLLNAVLLFLVLRSMTGARWPCAFVAAAFALHPLHVESVAWVTERKDVLSTLFWLLALGAYVRYARAGRRGWYAVSLLLYVCGLLAKPMVITLPFVLLLFDVWPLGRVSDDEAAKAGLARLILEKIPFLVPAAVAAALTLMGQAYHEALQPLDSVPIAMRLANAAYAYSHYIARALWPAGLAVSTSLGAPDHLMLRGAAAAAGIVAVTAACAAASRRRPCLLVGWLFYLATLLPVSGLAQTGLQTVADRFSYVPLIGLFIMAAWGLPALIPLPARREAVLGAAAGVWLTLMALLAARQAATWKDSISVFEHALRATRNNQLAHMNLGATLIKEGVRFDEATNHFAQALALESDELAPHLNWGNALLDRGRYEEAIAHLELVVEPPPLRAQAEDSWGVALARRGRVEEALPHFETALEIVPHFEKAILDLAIAEAALGREEDAVATYRKLLALNPNNMQGLNNLAFILATTRNAALRDAASALQMAAHASTLTSYADPAVLDTLAAAYAATGQKDMALAAGQRALELARAQKKADLTKDIRAHLHLIRQGGWPGKPKP